MRKTEEEEEKEEEEKEEEEKEEEEKEEGGGGKRGTARMGQNLPTWSARKEPLFRGVPHKVLPATFALVFL